MGKFNDLINGDKPVLVDFHATWCGPCKTQAPILNQLKGMLRDDITILKVDVDKNQNLASKYNVRGVPTLIIFKNGEITWRKSGVVQAKKLADIIEAL